MLDKILGNEICCKELMLIRRMGNSCDTGENIFLFAFLYGSDKESSEKCNTKRQYINL